MFAYKSIDKNKKQKYNCTTTNSTIIFFIVLLHKYNIDFIQTISNM